MAIVPPIKSQGIKTKLSKWIYINSMHVKYDCWVEPFLGTGAVAFNVRARRALLCDSNPHLISFYCALQSGEITGEKVRQFLVVEGGKLNASGGEYYYEVRERFNEHASPYDFLFLSRACFNGMMRFNGKGKFNVPFCKKPNRFAKALITKISNQVDAVAGLLAAGDYVFKHQDFSKTLSEVDSKSLIYCDPPYLGRHVDYFDSWNMAQEKLLHGLLCSSGAKFILSTWLKNKYRTNENIFSTWKNCFVTTKEHFYHVGASESNRNLVIEALLTNYRTAQSNSVIEIEKTINSSQLWQLAS